MTKGNRNEKPQKNTQDSKNNGTESTKRDHDEKDTVIDALRSEINNLKKKIADQDETIDDLVQERDEESNEMYELRLALADAWNIKRATKHEKIWEVLRIRREIKASKERGEKKSYCEVVKSSDYRTSEGTEKQNNEAQLNTCSSTDSADSGLGMHSLTQLIDERINLVVDTKLKSWEKAETGIEPTKNGIGQSTMTRTNLNPDREKNVIIHGLKETDQCDIKLVENIFEATATHHKPAHIIRLGQKKEDRTRPLLVHMTNTDQKDEFMSKLWMLKNVRSRFGNISIAHDLTSEERNLIKKWVEEAERRNMKETNEYRWRVRGTPRTGMRLVKIMKEEK